MYRGNKVIKELGNENNIESWKIFQIKINILKLLTDVQNKF